MLPDTLYVNGLSYAAVKEPPVVARPLYFIPHDNMRYDYDDRRRIISLGWKYNPLHNGTRRDSAAKTSKPEVYRVDPWQGWQSDAALQDLIWHINPWLSRAKAMTLLGSGLAFCNGEWGRFDGPRLMGGWTVTGTEEGSKLWVDTIRVDRPLPSAEEVIADPTKWGWCVSVRPNSLIGMWHRLGLDGTYHTVRMPVVSAAPVWVLLDEVLPVNEVKNPQWMG